MLLYVTEINENISEDILEDRMSLLCSNRRQKALAYKNPKDRIRSIAAGLLLQQGLTDKLADGGKFASKGMVTAGIEIKEGAKGKPYLAEFPGLFFNISHSGDMVGCVFAEQEIGFDIQQIRPCKQDMLIKKFHPDERMYYENMDEVSRTFFFFRLWAIKEAYVKYTGEGLSEGFASFRVDMDTQSIFDAKQNRVAKYAEISFENKEYCGAIVAKEQVELRKIVKSHL